MFSAEDFLGGVIFSRCLHLYPSEKNKYTEMYFKYIYFMLSILQTHLHISVLNKNTLQLYFWYTKLVKLEQLILYVTHFNCAEVQLKIY